MESIKKSSSWKSLEVHFNSMKTVHMRDLFSEDKDRFKKNHPNNFIDVGIAEQNLIGIAAGLASENFKVITTTFSPFQILRCCEQIKVNLGYMKQNVTMVGLASGLALGALGFTHASIV